MYFFFIIFIFLIFHRKFLFYFPIIILTTINKKYEKKTSEGRKYELTTELNKNEDKLKKTREKKRKRRGGAGKKGTKYKYMYFRLRCIPYCLVVSDRIRIPIFPGKYVFFFYFNFFKFSIKILNSLSIYKLQLT